MNFDVAMPYYDRQLALSHSLASYMRTYPKLDFNLYICDDGSPEPMRFPVAWASRIRVQNLPRKNVALNPCVPINVAVNTSEEDIIVLTNPEVEHEEPVFQEMLKEVDENRYVICACKDKTTGDWLCHTSVKGGKKGRGPMPEGSGFHFCVMFHRGLWERAGGFDIEYRAGQAFDDNDWLWRLDRAGAEFVLRDDLVVYHHRVGTRWPEGGWLRNKKLFDLKWPLSS